MSKILNLFKKNPDIILLVFYFFCISFLDIGLRKTYLSFVFLLTWCGIASIKIIQSKRIFVSKWMIALIIFLISQFLRTIFLEPTAVSGNFLTNLSLFSGLLFFEYYDNKLDRTNKRILIMMILFIWVCLALRNLIFYIHNPGIARIIISSHIYFQFIAHPYDLAYGSALIAVALFGLFLKNRLKIIHFENLITLIIVVLLVFLLIKTESTITFLAAILGLVSSTLLICSKKSFLIRIVMTIIIFVIACIFVSSKYEIGLWMISTFDPYRSVFECKLYNIGSSLVVGEANGNLGFRLELYETSWKYFLEHPFLGSELDGNLATNHSEFFDSFARYGLLFGVIPYLYLFYYSLRRLKYIKQLECIPIILTFIFMFFFNPFHSDLSNFSIFFIVPMLGNLRKGC